ncbi:MAG: enoyl-CoA hydratase/isomerase family protein [Devosia sp.]|nr:enoyl-CoA hydratase/isomerase family protein [Devosia sp.]
MSPRVEVDRIGGCAVITLDRPEAINALGRDMIDAIAGALAQWQNDPEVRLVLFEGRGPRGFCSGGDVKAVRGLVLEGRHAEADAYFAAEYAMNGLIAHYPKPVAVLSHGVVMGGGIGIAGHCRYRFTTPNARFAMPESAIGFFCDVGVNAILARAPLHRALAFALSGVPVGAADALALGLADCVIDEARHDVVRSAIIEAAGSADIDAALTHLMQREMTPMGEAPFCAAVDRLAGIDWAILEEAVAALAAEPVTAVAAQRSPTSLVAIHQSHTASRALADVREVLALDLAFSRLLSRTPDFAEGVRAVLVDRDQSPRWSPQTVAAVASAGFASAIAALSPAGSAGT